MRWKWKLKVGRFLKKVKISISSGPDRNIVSTNLKKISDTLYGVSWTPKVEGKHEMSLLVGGEYVNGTPITIPVLDPSAVRVIGLRNERVGTEVQFNGLPPFLSVEK